MISSNHWTEPASQGSAIAWHMRQEGYIERQVKKCVNPTKMKTWMIWQVEVSKSGNFLCCIRTNALLYPLLSIGFLLKDRSEHCSPLGLYKCGPDLASKNPCDSARRRHKGKCAKPEAANLGRVELGVTFNTFKTLLSCACGQVKLNTATSNNADTAKSNFCAMPEESAGRESVSMSMQRQTTVRRMR